MWIFLLRSVINNGIDKGEYFFLSDSMRDLVVTHYEHGIRPLLTFFIAPLCHTAKILTECCLPNFRCCRIVHQFFVAQYCFPGHWIDHGIGKVFEVDVLGARAGSVQFGRGECRGHCIMGHVCEHAQGLLGHNIVRGQWDS
jgi:hypothetical protein